MNVYLAHYQFPEDVFSRSPEYLELFIVNWILFTRINRKPIKSVTINQYLSAVITGLKKLRTASALQSHLRTPFTGMLFKALSHTDRLLCPKRLSESIPATCQIVALALREIERQYESTNASLCLEISALLLLTYFVALRAEEGSSSGYSDDPGHSINSDTVAVQFEGHPHLYPVTNTEAFPIGGVPISIDFLQDSAKCVTSRRGSAHRSAARNPDGPDKPFCVVSVLFRYIMNNPPAPGSKFFPTARSHHVTPVLKTVARNTKLDEHRMSIKSLRSGSATMVASMKKNIITPEERARIGAHGQWESEVGRHIYVHSAADKHSAAVAPSLYDEGYMTIPYLIWYYMTPVPM